MTSTAFGSSWNLPPNAAVSVLRAQASKSLNLLPVALPDAAACVMAGHIWAKITNTSSLSSAAYCSPEAIRAAANILSRAAGHTCGLGVAVEEFDDIEFSYLGSTATVDTAVSESLRWAYSFFDKTTQAPALCDALLSAAQDLGSSTGSVAKQAQALRYAASVLTVEAEAVLYF